MAKVYLRGTTPQNPVGAYRLDRQLEEEEVQSGDTMTGLKAGWDSLKATGYGAVGLAGAAAGVDSVRDWGIEGYQENMAKVAENQRPEYTAEGVDSVGKAVDFTQYWLGYAAPQIASSILSGGIGSLIAKQATKSGVKAVIQNRIASEVGDKVQGAARDKIIARITNEVTDAVVKKGNLAGLGANAMATELGATYGGAVEEQLAQGKTADDVDLMKVAGYGAAAGAVEFASDVATLGLARIGPAKDAMNLLSTAKRPARVVGRGIAGATAEGLTEQLQTGLEEMGAGKTYEEANFSDPTSFWAGAVGGGAMGAVGGLQNPPDNTPRPSIQDEVNTAIQDQEQRELAAIRMQQVEAEEKRLAAEREARRQTLGAQMETIIPRGEVKKRWESELGEQLVDPETEVAQAYKQWQSETKNYTDDPKARSQFFKEYSKETGFNDQEYYVQTLDEYIKYREDLDSMTRPERAEFDRETTLFAQALDDAQEVGNEQVLSSLEVAAEKALGKFRWAEIKRESQLNQQAQKEQARVQKEQDKATKAEATQAAKEAKVNATKEAKPTKASRTDPEVQARQRAATALGENWEEEHGSLSVLVAERRWADFHKEVDQSIREQAIYAERDATNKEQRKEAEEKAKKEAKLNKNPAAAVGDVADPITQLPENNAKDFYEYETDKSWDDVPPELQKKLIAKPTGEVLEQVETQLAAINEAIKVQEKTDIVDSASEALTEGKRGQKMSGGEQRVYDFLIDAIAKGDAEKYLIPPEDTKNSAGEGSNIVLQDGGVKQVSFATEAIAKELGMKRGVVTTNLKRVKDKVAKALNKSPEQVKTDLRKTRRGETEAFEDMAGDAPENQSSDFDKNDLFDSEGKPLAQVTAGGSQSDVGVVDAAQEEFNNARSQKDDFEQKRNEAANAQATKDLAVLMKHPSFTKLVGSWGEFKSEDAPSFLELSPVDQVRWILNYSEYLEGNFEYGDLKDAEALELYQREIERQAIDGVNKNGTEENNGVGTETGTGVLEGSREAIREVEEGKPRQRVPARADKSDGKVRVEAEKPRRLSNKEKGNLPTDENFRLATLEAAIEDAVLENETNIDGINRLTDALGMERLPVLEYKGASYIDTEELTKELNRSHPDDVKPLVEDALGLDINPETGTRLSVGPIVGGETSVEALRTASEELFGKSDRINIFATEEDAIVDATVKRIVNSKKKGRVQGFVTEDANGVLSAYLIAENIQAGNERAVIMHEVGAHLGIDAVLSEEQVSGLTRKISTWAEKGKATLESRLAIRAINRAGLANTPNADLNSEVVAYFIEEATKAGILPTSKYSPTSAFLKFVWKAFTQALNKLGLVKTSDLTAQDIVTLAYGAANVELSKNVNAETALQRFDTKGVDKAPKYSVTQAEYRDQIGDVLGDKAKKVFDDTSFIARNAANSTKFLHQFIRDVKESMPSAGKWYRSILESERTANGIRQGVESVANRARELSSERLEVVNKIIGDATFTQRWPYNPKIFDPQLFKGDYVVDATYSERFDALKPEEQAIVRDVFAHGEFIKSQKLEILKEMGVSRSLFGFNTSMKGPYAPLKRFGNYFAVLKSKRVLALEAEIAEGGPATKKQTEALDDLKSNPAEYIVSYFDTIGAANAFRDANKDKYAEATSGVRTSEMDDGRSTNTQALEKVMASIRADKEMPTEIKSRIDSMVKELYFNALDEKNARHSSQQRKGRAGYNENMMRSFLEQSRADSLLIAQMKHGADINQAFIEARRESQGSNELNETYKMIEQHYKDMLTFKDTPIQNRVAAMNTLYMLTSSVGYHVQNMTQPIMATIPLIAGDTGDYSGTWASYFKNAKRAVGMLASDLKTKQAVIDVTKAPSKYQAMLSELDLLQLLDVGMDSDLSSFTSFNTGYKIIDDASGFVSRITHKGYQIARYVEGLNRLSSAMTAFDLAEKHPGMTRGLTPQAYAVNVVQDTQGNFSRTDAPLILKKLPKITGQYRKYQLMMAWLYANSAKRVLKGDSVQERWAGGRVLGYKLFHAGAFAGATGLPVSGIASWVTAFLNEGDEPEDLERWIRRNVQDENVANVISRGLFGAVGIDMSSKLGEQNVFKILPYTEFELSADGFKNALFDIAAGPLGAQVGNFGRSAEYLGQGDVFKAVEYAVPKGIRTMMESYRLGTEGYTFKNGDMVAPPTQFDAYDLIVNGLGLPTNEIRDLKWTNSQQYELTKWVNDQTKKIRADYIKAYRDKNWKAMSELKDDWRDLQDAKDRIRPFFNNAPTELRRQPTRNLTKAPKEQRKREAKSQDRLGTN